jgi:hypothetical protein
MLRSDAWSALASQNQEIVFLYYFAQKECGITLSASPFARVFEFQEFYGHRIHSQAKTMPSTPC